MINYNKNKNENQIAHIYDIFRPGPRQGHKYTKYKVSRYDGPFM